MPANGKPAVPAIRPRAEFEGLHESLHDLFDFRWPRGLRNQLLQVPEPAIDMFERDGSVVVKAEMPGIEADKIDVPVSDGELRISGERSEEKEVKEQDYYRSERKYGRVYRAIALPEGCDAEQVSATIKDGVIEVVIPRKAAAAGRKIEVKPAS